VQAITDAALRLLRRDGIDALTMRSLADELGVRASTLYHHVRSKGQLLDLLGAQAFRSLPRAHGGYDQVGDLAARLAVLHEDVARLRAFYRDHPGLARAIVHQGDMGDVPHDHTAGERRAPELDALVRLGIPEDRALRFVLAVARWTMAALSAEPGAAGRPLEELDRADALFDDGLDLLLAGLATRLGEQDMPVGGAVPDPAGIRRGRPRTPSGPRWRPGPGR
jgi:TetR/AcrR family transcriptional regulator, tetracycline repressor protein